MLQMMIALPTVGTLAYFGARHRTFAFSLAHGELVIETTRGSVCSMRDGCANTASRFCVTGALDLRLDCFGGMDETRSCIDPGLVRPKVESKRRHT